MTANEGAAGTTAPAAPAVFEQSTVLPEKSERAQHWNDLYNLAKLIADTEMVPGKLRKRADAVFATMALGDEIGVGPFAALRNIDLIDGIPRPSAMLQRALILRAGHVLEWREVSGTRVALYGRRRDDGRQLIVTWTLDDARTAKIAGKGNWQTYPRAMLAARATSELGRLLFADVLLGLEYTPEEVGAVGPYSAIDVEYAPGDDDVPVIDDDEVDEDTPAHIVQAEMLDAEDQLDAQWLAEARGDTEGGDDADDDD